MALWVAAVALMIPASMFASELTAREGQNAISRRGNKQIITALEFEDITPEPGMLLTRARYTFDMYKAYTPQHVLSLNYSTTPSDHAFPGDTIGRYILSATLLSRALHEAEPETLKQVMAALPGMLNQEGYLGWVLPANKADETGLSNVQWANGLSEYFAWKKDPSALEMNRSVFANIILPVKEAFYYYYTPEKNDRKITWVHCTADTAQGFGIIDPATRGYALFPSRELKDEVDELIRLYSKIDRVKIQAQIHATLFLTRGLLRWYEPHGDPKHLELAKVIYDQYRNLAMTENYENYNWFGRPEWTEGCAVVDSLSVVERLWQMTGETRYLADAQLILYNALLANQKGGDFGTETCVGPKGQIFLKNKSAAPWCCSVWGGKGLARAIQSSYYLANGSLVVANFVNSTVVARLPGGELRLRQTSHYPYESEIKFEVLASASKKARELRIYIPPWIVPQSLVVTVAGKQVGRNLKDSFLVIRRGFAVGDIIQLRFQQRAGAADLLDPQRTPGHHRFMHGPLVLGVDATQEQSVPRAEELQSLGNGCYQAKSSGVTLAPLCDLSNQRDEATRAKTKSVQVLFKD